MKRRGKLVSRTNLVGYSEPPQDALLSIIPGSFVLLLAEIAGNEGGERFWCRVIENTGDRLSVEITQADMLYANVHDFYPNDVLEIVTENVLAIRGPNGSLRWEIKQNEQIQPA